MLKKNYICDCFFDISCSCLEVDDDFVKFQRKCLKQRSFRDIFVIRGWTERRRSQFYPTKFVVCCKAFLDFQIDFFVKKETFRLRKVSCNYNLENDEFESDFDYDKIINCDSDDDNVCNNSKQTTSCFESSVCFSKNGYNLSFGRFCLRCKQVFLRYFTRELHLIEKNMFFSK